MLAGANIQMHASTLGLVAIRLGGLNASIVLPACVTIALTFAGLVYKHFEEHSLQRRRDRLDRVNLQLRQLYGPLHALSRAGADAWRIFRQGHRPPQERRYFDPADPPTHAEQVAYRVWMEEVFMPINLRLEEIIVGNADLLVEGQMPECLLRVCAHVNAYKPVLRQWRENDYSHHEAPIAFPEEELTSYLDRTFVELQRQQRQLLGSLRIRAKQ
ncbi:MAG TPA: hypothetical protein VGD62_05045 [Acidobacteriaceae bacterium]